MPHISLGGRDRVVIFYQQNRSIYDCMRPYFISNALLHYSELIHHDSCIKPDVVWMLYYVVCVNILLLGLNKDPYFVIIHLQGLI